jgi:hypothetical protein
VIDEQTAPPLFILLHSIAFIYLLRCRYDSVSFETSTVSLLSCLQYRVSISGLISMGSFECALMNLYWYRHICLFTSQITQSKENMMNRRLDNNLVEFRAYNATRKTKVTVPPLNLTSKCLAEVNRSILRWSIVWSNPLLLFNHFWHWALANFD